MFPPPDEVTAFIHRIRQWNETAITAVWSAVWGRTVYRVDDIIAVQEALIRLARTNLPSALLIEMRFYEGMTLEQGANMLGVSTRTARRNYAIAIAQLRVQLGA